MKYLLFISSYLTLRTPSGVVLTLVHAASHSLFSRRVLDLGAEVSGWHLSSQWDAVP